MLEGRFEDKIAKEGNNARRNIIGQGPGGIIDIQIGPDGYLYIISLFVTLSDCDKIMDKKSVAGCEIPGSPLKRAIFKITPKDKVSSSFKNVTIRLNTSLMPFLV